MPTRNIPSRYDLWLPLQAKAQSASVGIDGRARTSAEIDATVTHVMQGAEVPGLGLALINNGKIAYLKAYGVKNTSAKEPLTVDSVMVATSLTKVAFAYLVMKLVDDHVIDIDAWAFRILRETAGKDEFISNPEWAHRAP